jgi:16S rRNA (adenine1518-N6/adenine1519-N6)-dimethyltransferase
MFEIIKYAFLQRRKTLINALSADKNLDKSSVADAVNRCGFDEKIRGEALSILDFRRLSDELS